MSDVKTWADRIAAAEKRGKFTKKDKWLAHRFNTCAVGEKLHLNADTPYDESNRKVRDARLQTLGIDFLSAVASQDILQAKRVYEEIQESK